MILNNIYHQKKDEIHLYDFIDDFIEINEELNIEKCFQEYK